MTEFTYVEMISDYMEIIDSYLLNKLFTFYKIIGQYMVNRDNISR